MFQSVRKPRRYIIFSEKFDQQLSGFDLQSVFYKMYQAYASSKLRKIFVEREQLCQAVQQSSIQNQPKLAFVVDPLTIPIFLNIFAHFTPNMTFCGVETSD